MKMQPFISYAIKMSSCSRVIFTILKARAISYSACSLLRRFSGKGYDDFNSAETLHGRRWHKGGSHEIERRRGYDSSTGGIAGFADIERRIEIQRLDLTLVFPRELDPGEPIAQRKIGCIDVSHRPIQGNPLTRKIAERR